MKFKCLVTPTAAALSLLANSPAIFAAPVAHVHGSGHTTTAKMTAKAENAADQKAQEILSKLIACTSDPNAKNYIGSAPRFDPIIRRPPSTQPAVAPSASSTTAAAATQTTPATSKTGAAAPPQTGVTIVHSDMRDFMESNRLYGMRSNEISNGAIAELQLLGPGIAPFLAKQLNSASPMVANVCASTLAKFGTISIEPVVQVVRERGFNSGATQALRLIGSDSLTPLFQMLESTKESEKLAAAATIDSLIPRYASSGNFDNVHTQTMLPSSSMVDLICKAAVSEKTAKVRQFEASIFGRIGPRRGVMETLNKLAETDGDPAVRGTAITSIGEVIETQSDKGAVSSVKTLIKIANEDEFDGCRTEAVRALGTGQKDPEIAIPALVALLDDSRLTVIDASLASLTRYRGKAAEALPALMKILEKNVNSHQTAAAIQAIGQMDESAKPALDSLVQKTSSSDSHVATSALTALRNLSKTNDLKPYVQKFASLLQSNEHFIRFNAIEILAGLGPDAISAKDALEACAKAYPHDATRVQNALKQIAPQQESR